MMINSTYDFEGGTIVPLDTNVLSVTFRSNDKITRAAIENAYKAKLDLIGNTPHGTIISCENGFGKLTAEAKAMILTNIDPFDKNFVTVLLAKGSFEKIEISIFLKLHPSSDNIVIVKTKEDAMAAIKKAKAALNSVNLAG